METPFAEVCVRFNVYYILKYDISYHAKSLCQYIFSGCLIQRIQLSSSLLHPPRLAILFMSTIQIILLVHQTQFLDHAIPL